MGQDQHEILRNPKYTGYQVFNRRASRSGRGKVNDPRKWVWSPEPVHEPLIPKWMYDAINARRQARKGSRHGGGENSHPATRHTYLLRGMLHCECGRKMFGNARHGTTYYTCYPRANNRGRPDKYQGHPKTIYLREKTILDAVIRFYDDRLFGPNRRVLLAADLANIDDRAARERQAERERLHRALADIARRQDGVIRQAEDGDPKDPTGTFAGQAA